MLARRLHDVISVPIRRRLRPTHRDLIMLEARAFTDFGVARAKPRLLTRVRQLLLRVPTNECGNSQADHDVVVVTPEEFERVRQCRAANRRNPRRQRRRGRNCSAPCQYRRRAKNPPLHFWISQDGRLPIPVRSPRVQGFFERELRMFTDFKVGGYCRVFILPTQGSMPPAFGASIPCHLPS